MRGNCGYKGYHALLHKSLSFRRALLTDFKDILFCHRHMVYSYRMAPGNILLRVGRLEKIFLAKDNRGTDTNGHTHRYGVWWIHTLAKDHISLHSDGNIHHRGSPNPLLLRVGALSPCPSQIIAYEIQGKQPAYISSDSRDDM